MSRHTPTLVWSLTWSMMLLSSEKRPPTVLPWPLMFSNTDHITTEGGSHQFQDTQRWSLLSALHSCSAVRGSSLKQNRFHLGMKCLCVIKMALQECYSTESDMQHHLISILQSVSFDYSELRIQENKIQNISLFYSLVLLIMYKEINSRKGESQ